MTATTALPTFNPLDPDLRKNPCPTYARCRKEDPVRWGVATLRDLNGSWYLFRHSKAESVPTAFQPVAYVFQHWLGGMIRRTTASCARSSPRRLRRAGSPCWIPTSSPSPVS
ncbi:hypothetical protein [Streptomyces sp. NPDC001978]|uniref:hypothetical protein n=1 Tax=Streptomyces sp. NPDC001978 TaxID=3364627 RepID=UPI0036C9AB10